METVWGRVTESANFEEEVATKKEHRIIKRRLGILKRKAKARWLKQLAMKLNAAADEGDWGRFYGTLKKVGVVVQVLREKGWRGSSWIGYGNTARRGGGKNWKCPRT
jgi:hypothetical protein